MPLQATSGAASYDAFGGGVPVAANYIEDVFQTWLYTGTGANQTITNGVDLAGKGGLVWTKSRTTAGYSNGLVDTVRGARNTLRSNETIASYDDDSVVSFASTGFTVGPSSISGNGGDNYASWTFREQPKFFDVVTYTGDGVAGRTVAHNLGSVPGCIIVKPTSTSGEWRVWHGALAAPASSFLFLNRTDAEVTGSTIWNSTNPTSTNFTVSGSSSNNGAGVEYVAYLFAHNAGGFGLSGTDNVISCGSFTTDGSGDASVTLGYEPQLVIMKRSNGAGNWNILDNMRGWSVSGSDAQLQPNNAGAEVLAEWGAPNATGFTVTGGNFAASSQVIYIAIRRGPMKTPTTGTSVFSPNFQGGSGSASTPNYPAGFPVDLMMRGLRTGGNSAYPMTMDRLRGTSPYLVTSSTAAEVADTTWQFDSMTGVYSPTASTNTNIIGWLMRRAPGFFDEVCYTGTRPTVQTVTHNLGVVPELMIVKNRGSAGGWRVWNKTIFAANPANFLVLNSSFQQSSDNSYFNSTAPTSTVFTVGTDNDVNMAGVPLVAYLFASCPGVSRVGSYTGTGTTQTINCGFAGGARFVLIKRTDSTGDWYVWDSARGIVAGNDPYLLLNSTAAEVTSTDFVDTAATGFELSSTAPAALNASGGSYIFLAIA
jgi:hypothetical protein